MSAIRPRVGRPSATTSEQSRGRATVDPTRAERYGRRALLAIVLLAVLANAAFAFTDRRLRDDPLVTSASGTSDKLVLAVAIDTERTIVATRDNVVSIVVDGSAVARTPLPKTVGALAASPDGSQIYAGTSDGVVTILDETLVQTGQVTVEGRVVGLATTPQGVYIAHGIGTSGNRYYVTRVSDPAAAPVSSTQTGFAISTLTVSGQDALYGTGNARVGRIDPSGRLLWETTLPSPITRLHALPDGGVLAGGDDGTLSRIDAAGAILWSAAISEYPLRGLAFDQDDSIAFVGDSDGALNAVDAADGAVRVERTVADADVEAILPSGSEQFLMVPRQGEWQTLDAGALSAAELSNSLRIAWAATNAALLVAGAGAAVVAVDRWRIAARRQARLAWRARIAYVLAIPAIALIAIFAYYPAGMAFYYSLTNFSLREVTEFVGLDNYRDVLFDDQYFRTGFGNMALIVATSILKTITVPLLVAELVFWLRNGVHQYIFRTLFVLPAVVPDLVFTLMWRQVYEPNTGLLNQLLASMGFAQFQRAWLGDEDTALWAVIAVGFPFVSAFAFLIFLGGLLSVNGEYFDAAKVDGASWWQRFMHMDVPLLMPQFRILLFFAVTGTIQGFAGIFILTRGGPGFSTYIPALQMYLRISEGDLGYASAIGVVLFVLILALTLIILRFRRNDAIETS